MDSQLTFRFELIRSIGGIRLSKLPGNFNKRSRLRQYLYHCALKSSAILLERECDDLIGKNISFDDELKKYALKTVLYRICVDYDTVDPTKTGSSFKSDLVRTILSFGSRLKGYLRLSHDLDEDNVRYLVFHLVLQTKIAESIRNFDIALKQLLRGEKMNELLSHGTERNDQELGSNVRREYSKYIFTEGIIFKGFNCLLPPDGLQGKMISLLYGDRSGDDYDYEPKLGINCVPFSSDLYNNQFENASSTTSILTGDFVDVLEDWQVVRGFTTREHRFFEEHDIERMYFQRHKALKTQGRSNFINIVDSGSTDEEKEKQKANTDNAENTQEEKEKENKESKEDGSNDASNNTGGKNDSKENKQIKQIMLVSELHQETDFIVPEEIYRSHMPTGYENFKNVQVVANKSKTQKNSGNKPEIAKTVTKIAFGKRIDSQLLRLLYLLLIGQHEKEVKNCHPVLLANCYVILDREHATKLKTIIVDEFASRITDNQFFE